MYTSFSLPIDPILLLKRRQRRVHLLKFLKESLLDLQKQFQKYDFKNEKTKSNYDNFNVSGKLVFLFGGKSSIIKHIIQKDRDIEAIFVNRDYTPYSRKRDSLIKIICEMFNVDFIECPDILINEPEDILNSNNKPFKVFSQYYNKAIEIQLRRENFFDKKKLLENITSFDIQKLVNINNIKVISNLDKFFFLIDSENTDLLYTLPIVLGSRERYYNLLLDLKNRHKKSNIDNEKNSFDYSSSHLSLYLKFGLCSIREVYSAVMRELGHNHPLLRQLYWRDFLYILHSISRLYLIVLFKKDIEI